jgi:hypothetical protein
MKIIKLYGVHYLSYNGILLNSENNFVEATEENILKLHKYIENKYVKVVELDENGKEIIEENKNEVKEQIKELFEEKKDEKEVVETITEQTEENEEENQSTEEEKSEKKSKKSSKK